jgi:hypothetical protein
MVAVLYRIACQEVKWSGRAAEASDRHRDDGAR